MKLAIWFCAHIIMTACMSIGRFAADIGIRWQTAGLKTVYNGTLPSTAICMLLQIISIWIPQATVSENVSRIRNNLKKKST